MSRPQLVVPPALVASHERYFGEAGRRWVGELPGLAEQWLESWQLVADGALRTGAVALVLPVRRADGTAAVLKLQPVDDETRGEAAALRSWAELGAVQLLEHDPPSGSMLLERLDADRSLAQVPDDLAAAEVIAGLLRGLHSVRAPAGLRRLDVIAARMLDGLPRVLTVVPDPTVRVLLTRIGDQLRELRSDPVDDRLLHWDLHYDNVLATLEPDQPQPWRAIDPKPLSGDPGFDLLPALWNRWDDVVATGDVPRAVRRRFGRMVEVAGIDPERARVWTLARVLQEASWSFGAAGATVLAPSHRAIADTLIQ